MTGKAGDTSPGLHAQDDVLSEMAPHPTASYEDSVRSVALIALMKRLLPFVAGLLVVVMVLWPVLNNKERKFTLSVESLEKRDRSLRVVNPHYSGLDDKGRPFKISAQTAVQTYDGGMQVTLDGLAAALTVKEDLQINVTVKAGQYDAGASLLYLDDEIELISSNGYELQAGGGLVDLSQATAEGDKGVTGKAPFGVFAAQRFWADVTAEELKFEGRVKVRLDPGHVTIRETPPIAGGTGVKSTEQTGPVGVE